MDGGSEPEIKPYHEFTQISVHKSGDQYYLICGAKVVFALDEGNAYSQNLSPDEIDNLKFSIMWLGPKVKVTYETSDKEAVFALLNIIKNINTNTTLEALILVHILKITRIKCEKFQCILFKIAGVLIKIS